MYWPFFAFDNGVGRGVWAPAVQAETVKRLGYDGIHYNYTNPADFRKKLDACMATGVPINAVYIYTDVEAFLRLLNDAGYKGPIGHQVYGVKGDDKEKLELAIKAWRMAKKQMLTERKSE